MNVTKQAFSRHSICRQNQRQRGLGSATALVGEKACRLCKISFVVQPLPTKLCGRTCCVLDYGKLNAVRNANSIYGRHDGTPSCIKARMNDPGELWSSATQHGCRN